MNLPLMTGWGINGKLSNAVIHILLLQSDPPHLLTTSCGRDTWRMWGGSIASLSPKHYNNLCQCGLDILDGGCWSTVKPTSSTPRTVMANVFLIDEMFSLSHIPIFYDWVFHEVNKWWSIKGVSCVSCKLGTKAANGSYRDKTRAESGNWWPIMISNGSASACPGARVC